MSPQGRGRPLNVLGTPGSWIDAGSGVLLLALGAFLLTVRPRRRANLALGAFAVLFGTAQFLGNLVRDAEGADPLTDPVLVLRALAGIPLVLVAWWVPRPVPPEQRGLLVYLPVAAVVASSGLWALSQVMNPSASGPLDLRWAVQELVLESVAAGAFYVALLSQALRYPSLAGAPTGRERRNALLLSAALLTFPGWLAGLALGMTAEQFSAEFPAFLDDTGLGALPGGVLSAVFIANNTWLVFHLALAALWLRNGQTPGSGRGPRNLALLALALPLAGMLARPFLGPVPGDAGLNGAMRLVTVAILAYAILRHQLLEIDVKVRWGIRQSTLAAAFVGVFFVVSEGAQSVFATTANSELLGIAAAGLLVFALAPLQQAAERLASAAVPGAKPVGEMTRDERGEVYRAMARAAWQDGALDRSERALLLELRNRLGLSGAEAERLEAEALA